jgi:outer membrane protein assembly factor BamB
MRVPARSVLLLLVVACARIVLTAFQDPGTAKWPGYRGEDRTGVYHGTIRTSLDGVTSIWKKKIGGGRASFAIADGRAFTIEQRQKDEVVAAYDVMSGKELWTSSWPERFSQWMGGGEGPRATPTWADGDVFSLGAAGELRAFEAATGKVIWRTNILEDVKAKNLTWGMAASPLVVGDSVIVLPGGAAGKSMAAYDRHTGKHLWTALDDHAAYASPMLVTLGGVQQLLVVSSSRVMGVSTDRHQVLWDLPWKTDHDANAVQPIVIGDRRVFYSSGYGTGAAVVELTPNGDRFQVRDVWRNLRMKNRQSSSVFYNGFIYGLDDGILACLDAATGDLKWKGGRYGHGQVLLAGDQLLITTEDGDLVLVAATPAKLTELAHIQALNGETWNVPALADGILLVRNTTEMAAFDLRPEKK